METILTIHYNTDGTIYLRAYDKMGSLVHLGSLKGKTLKGIDAMYDDILVETED